MTNCDIIVTYCWNRVGYSIVKSLSNHGLKVWAADTSKINICSMSRYVTGSFIYPDPFTDEKRFIMCLLQKINELKPRVLIPTHDESVVIMRHRKEFPKDLIIPYESELKLIRLANKLIATREAKQAGIPVPCVYQSPDEVLKYPVVFKTVIGNSAKGVFFPKQRDELLMLMSKYETDDMLLEEWIEGSDYSVDCVRWNGFWKSSVYHAIVTKTDGGGTTTQREIVNEPDLEKYARILLDYLDFKGVCGLDFRYDPITGKVAFIEINARFTGGIATPIAAGFDIPWIIYKLATENTFNESIELTLGTRTKWIIGDMITLVGRLLSLKWNRKEINRVFTFRGFDAFDDFDKTDKKAILGEMCYYFVKLIKNGKLNP